MTDSLDNKIAFEPLKETHFPLLYAWLKNPHVKEFYDKNILWSEGLIRQKFKDYTEGFKWIQGAKKPIYAYIIQYEGNPIGYAQYYDAYDFPRDGYDLAAKLSYCQVEDGNLAALDIFIGTSEMTGKGIGAKAILKLLKEYIWKQFSACFVDPETINRKAVRSFEKAGFKTLSIVEEKKHLMFCHKTWQIPTFIRTGVYGVALLSDEILVIEQTRGVHQGKLDLPGGGIDPGETIEETLRREFFEEVGMTFGSMVSLCNLTATTENPQKTMRLHQIGLIYRLDNLSKIENQNPELEYTWLKISECKKRKVTPFLESILQRLDLCKDLDPPLKPCFFLETESPT